MTALASWELRPVASTAQSMTSVPTDATNMIQLTA